MDVQNVQNVQNHREQNAEGRRQKVEGRDAVGADQMQMQMQMQKLMPKPMPMAWNYLTVLTR